VIVRAKLAAMGVLAGAVLLALNGPPTVLHPVAALAMLHASVSGALRLMAAHAVTTTAAGVFGFTTVLAMREVARAALGGWWPAVSSRLQALLIVVLATAFLLIPGGLGHVAERITPPLSASWPTAANPALWFVGVHEVLAGTVIVDVEGPPLPRLLREHEALSARLHQRARAGAPPLALRGLAAILVSVSLAAGAFLWNARRPAARPRTPRRGGVPRPSPFVRAVTATVARRPAVQAGFFFAMRTLGRSVPHRAALAVAAAFGLAVATIGFGRAMRAPAGGAPIQALLGTQTLFVACLLAGCEQAMRLPAHLPASWSLKLAWPGDARGYVQGVKRAVVVGVGIPALTLLLLAHLWFVPSPLALAHFGVGVLLLLIAVEGRFIAEHPLPFLTSYVAGQRIKQAPIWFGAAVFVSAVLSAIEAAALATATGTAWLLGVLAAVWLALAWTGRRSGAPREDDLDVFQAQLDEATQLKL
jgi:hypothetical protein